MAIVLVERLACALSITTKSGDQISISACRSGRQRKHQHQHKHWNPQCDFSHSIYLLWIHWRKRLQRLFDNVPLPHGLGLPRRDVSACRRVIVWRVSASSRVGVSAGLAKRHQLRRRPPGYHRFRQSGPPKRLAGSASAERQLFPIPASPKSVVYSRSSARGTRSLSEPYLECCRQTSYHPLSRAQ